MRQTLVCDGSILRMKEDFYGDHPEDGSFIADTSINVDGISYFFIEVAFSQAREHLQNKIERILEKPLVIAVLVVNIDELPPYRSPRQRSKPDDFIERVNFMRWAMASQNGNRFSRIMVDGNTWMSNVEITMRLYKRQQANVVAYTPEVCCPHQTLMITPNSLLQCTIPSHGNASFPELETELQKIYNVIVAKINEVDGTNVQAGALDFRWDVARNQIHSGIRVTAYSRYYKWLGKENGRPGIV